MSIHTLNKHGSISNRMSLSNEFDCNLESNKRLSHIGPR